MPQTVGSTSPNSSPNSSSKGGTTDSPAGKMKRLWLDWEFCRAIEEPFTEDPPPYGHKKPHNVTDFEKQIIEAQSKTLFPVGFYDMTPIKRGVTKGRGFWKGKEALRLSNCSAEKNGCCFKVRFCRIPTGIEIFTSGTHNIKAHLTPRKRGLSPAVRTVITTYKEESQSKLVEWLKDGGLLHQAGVSDIDKVKQQIKRRKMTLKRQQKQEQEKRLSSPSSTLSASPSSSAYASGPPTPASAVARIPPGAEASPSLANTIARASGASAVARTPPGGAAASPSSLADTIAARASGGSVVKKKTTKKKQTKRKAKTHTPSPRELVLQVQKNIGNQNTNYQSPLVNPRIFDNKTQQKRNSPPNYQYVHAQEKDNNHRVVLEDPSYRFLAPPTKKQKTKRSSPYLFAAEEQAEQDYHGMSSSTRGNSSREPEDDDEEDPLRNSKIQMLPHDSIMSVIDPYIPGGLGPLPTTLADDQHPDDHDLEDDDDDGLFLPPVGNHGQDSPTGTPPPTTANHHHLLDPVGDEGIDLHGPYEEFFDDDEVGELQPPFEHIVSNPFCDPNSNYSPTSVATPPNNDKPSSATQQQQLLLPNNIESPAAKYPYQQHNLFEQAPLLHTTDLFDWKSNDYPLTHPPAVPAGGGQSKDQPKRNSRKKIAPAMPPTSPTPRVAAHPAGRRLNKIKDPGAAQASGGLSRRSRLSNSKDPPGLDPSGVYHSVAV